MFKFIKLNLKFMKYFLQSLFICFFTFSLNFSFSQNSVEYENRREAYIDNALLSPNGNIIALEAYRDLPITQSFLDDIYDVMYTKSTIDFDLVKLVRVLFLTDGSYDNEILESFEDLPFWVNNYDTIRGYWSENHMIMWMSSNWLLHESYGKDIDPNLEQRLKHYLKIKIQYGFYEFFSGIYMPYTLSGLLNLADFAQDPEIKENARLAALRLISELLLVANNEGVFYPAAGRSSHEKYSDPYTHSTFHLIYLLTGFGEEPFGVTHGSSFLATSDFDVSSVVDAFTENVDTVFQIAHSMDSVRIIHDSLAYVDRMMMQWSSGCYFHPDFALETATLITDSNMWEHLDFTDFSIAGDIDLSLVEGIAQSFSSISESTVLTGVDVAIFKNKNVGMASTQDYWKGNLGYNQIPFAATVGKTAVLIISGEFTTNWAGISKANRNDHLPYINQKSNVALVMYRGKEKVSLFGETIPDVMLQWYEDDFDETEESGYWLFGRQNDNFVAVRRHCQDTREGTYTCNERAGQTWIFIVGNEDMYGSYEDFKDLALASNYETEWYQDASSGDWVYASSIDFDTTSINYEWFEEERFLSINNAQSFNSERINLYPNPANDFVNIEMIDIDFQQVKLSIFNNLGQQVYAQNITENKSELQINVANWSDGVYFIKIESENDQVDFKKFIKSR